MVQPRQQDVTPYESERIGQERFENSSSVFTRLTVSDSTHTQDSL